MTSIIIPGLPDELALCILARLPHPRRVRLRRVCRAWKLALDDSSATLCNIRRTFNLCEARPVFTSLHAFHSLFTLLDSFSARSYRVPLPPQFSAIPYPHGLALGVVGLLDTHLIAATPKIPLARPTSTVVEQQESLELQGLYRFDVASMKWDNFRYSPLPTTLATLKVEQPYKHVVAADLDGGYLYVAEAFSSFHGFLEGVDRLCLKARTWETLPRPLLKRKGVAGVVLHGLFYLLGGFHDRRSTHVQNSGEIWDPASGEWRLVPALWPAEVFGKCFAASKVAVVMDCLYALRKDTILEELMYHESSSATWISLGYVPMVLPSSDRVRLLAVGKEL
ncbi:hypothetical protein L7F22_025821 [Adiantum nelumboides]|nr:hypothetical protein [Adiantum nelumboides]